MPRVVMCGTPNQHCSGSTLTTNTFLRSASPKGHPTHEAAYRCYRSYLIRELGYTDIGSRTFRPPNGGPLRVLTRKSKFGASLRLGKMGERHMPKAKGRSGVIIST